MKHKYVLCLVLIVLCGFGGLLHCFPQRVEILNRSQGHIKYWLFFKHRNGIEQHAESLIIAPGNTIIDGSALSFEYQKLKIITINGRQGQEYVLPSDAQAVNLVMRRNADYEPIINLGSNAADTPGQSYKSEATLLDTSGSPSITIINNTDTAQSIVLQCDQLHRYGYVIGMQHTITIEGGSRKKLEDLESEVLSGFAGFISWKNLSLSLAKKGSAALEPIILPKEDKPLDVVITGDGKYTVKPADVGTGGMFYVQNSARFWGDLEIIVVPWHERQEAIVLVPGEMRAIGFINRYKQIEIKKYTSKKTPPIVVKTSAFTGNGQDYLVAINPGWDFLNNMSEKTMPIDHQVAMQRAEKAGRFLHVQFINELARPINITMMGGKHVAIVVAPHKSVMSKMSVHDFDKPPTFTIDYNADGVNWSWNAGKDKLMAIYNQNKILVLKTTSDTGVEVEEGSRRPWYAAILQSLYNLKKSEQKKRAR